MKNKKGFTLIELLAVVIILGILMTVGGIAVTRITENTRKNTFVNTAQEYKEAVRTLWSGDSIYCGSKDNISSDVEDGNYYILIDTTDQRFSYLLEKNNKSPWGNRDLKGYVRVNVSTNDKGHKEIKYYVSITDGIHAIKDNKEADKIKKGDLEMNISKDQATLDTINKIPFEVGKYTTCGEPGLGTDRIKYAKMLTGNKYSPQVGDMFSIKTEKFHVISSTSKTITGIAEYNLYVGLECYRDGSSKRYASEATGLQNSNMKGWVPGDYPYKGISSYPGHFGYRNNDTNKYLNEYKNKLTEMGVAINESRVISKHELETIFNCTSRCPTTYPWIYTTSYWTDDVYTEPNGSKWMWHIYSDGSFNHNNWYYGSSLGVRPVITLNKSEFE